MNVSALSEMRTILQHRVHDLLDARPVESAFLVDYTVEATSMKQEVARIFKASTQSEAQKQAVRVPERGSRDRVARLLLA